MTEEKKDQSLSDIEKNKFYAALSYFWILSVYVYLIKRKSKFAQFHAKQGIVLFLASLVTFVPVFGQLLGLAILVFSVVGIVKANNGEWFKLPFVYELSKKVKF